MTASTRSISTAAPAPSTMTPPRQKELRINIDPRSNRAYHLAAPEIAGHQQLHTSEESLQQPVVEQRQLRHPQLCPSVGTSTTTAYETMMHTCQQQLCINRDQRYGNQGNDITVSAIACINIDWRSEPNDDTAAPVITVYQQRPVPAVAVHQQPPAVLQPKQ